MKANFILLLAVVQGCLITLSAQDDIPIKLRFYKIIAATNKSIGSYYAAYVSGLSIFYSTFYFKGFTEGSDVNFKKDRFYRLNSMK